MWATYIMMQNGHGIALLERIHGQQPQLPIAMATAIHDITSDWPYRKAHSAAPVHSSILALSRSSQDSQ
jgi:hypothetical protein